MWSEIQPLNSMILVSFFSAEDTLSNGYKNKHRFELVILLKIHHSAFIGTPGIFETGHNYDPFCDVKMFV